MDFIAQAIRQPVTVTVGVMLIILAGVISLSRLPIQLTPNVESTVITVSTLWEGASPEEIEQNVVDKQEERLLGLSHLEEITSTSQQGFGRVRLQFATGTDQGKALQEVSDKLREVPEYPDGVDEPVIATSDEESRDYIAWIVFGSTDPDFDIDVLRDFAIDRIEPVLERVPGIAEIVVYGGQERELQIRVDPVLLSQYGVTPTQFANVVRDTNQNISAGRLADGKLDVRLRTIGQYRSPDEIGNTVLAHRNGGQILLRDVAEVVETYKEPDSFVRHKGVKVLAIPAEREIGSNVMEVMDGLRRVLDRLNAPGGVLDQEAQRLRLNGKLFVEQVYDQTVYIDDALALVRNNIFIGGALATLVLLLFLRSLRSVGIIALAIPISVIGAVVAIVAMGRSINVISLAGMAFSVGMVVDNAIVVLENIFRHIEMGKKPMEAAYAGAKEVWGAVLASTLTTIAVFVPILLIEEEAGQLFRDIALAICAAVLLSLIVSITVIPCAAGRVLRRLVTKRAEKGVEAHHRVAEFMGRMVYFLCGSVLIRLGVVGVLTAGAIVGTLMLMPPSDYLPKGNRNFVFGMVIPPPGYNIDQMSEIGRRIEQTVRPFWEASDLADDRAAYAGAVEQLPEMPTFDMTTMSPGAPVVPPTIHDYFLVSFQGLMFHGGICDEPQRAVDMMPLWDQSTRADVLPGVLAFSFQIPLFQLGGITGSAVKLQLVGTDLDQIVAAGEQTFFAIMGNPKFGVPQPAPANFNIPGPEIQVLPDLVRLSELGLTTFDIGMAVRANGDGAIVDEYHVGGEAIDLKVISSEAVGQKSINGLRDIPLATPSGRIVTLGSLAEIRRVGSPQEIARVGRQRAVTFQVTPQEGVSLEEAVDELNGIIASLRQSGGIPPGIEVNMAGSASKLQAVRTALLGDGSFAGLIASSLVLALLVVYLLMCILFQSFIKPMVIMFSVPLATLGGFAALAVVYLWTSSDRYMPIQKLDVLTMLGFVILIGVVVNNAILIVHQTLNFLTGRAETGLDKGLEMTPRRAIAEAVRTRVRPIFMSMCTSVGGMLPLILMPGSGSELYRGLGSVVVGGLIVSTIFTLLLVPLLLSLVFDVQRLFRRAEETAPEPAVAPAG
ncbi:MAG: efflux RND transporter permease subunit [Phycisphaerales bacterium]|nr:MAG: efflux RND transporter permease subunit [Phycisphaerales bacterium]